MSVRYLRISLRYMSLRMLRCYQCSQAHFVTQLNLWQAFMPQTLLPQRLPHCMVTPVKTTCLNDQASMKEPLLSLFSSTFRIRKCSLTPSDRNINAFLLVLILNGPRNTRRKSILFRCLKWSVNSWHCSWIQNYSLFDQTFIFLKAL